MAKQANVVYRDAIQTNEGSTTEAVKKVCKMFEKALMEFTESTKRRDTHAEIMEIKSRKTKKANEIKVEITFFVQHRLSFIKLQNANPHFQGFGRWA
jgi:hypothetical protein